ncbi:MAG: DegT/DnrJ/EryC1/StrS family aminotransferase [Myxococcota bacterium]
MRRLRPVGDRISTERRSVEPRELFPTAHSSAFYSSGTSALAAAVQLAVKDGPAHPEVLIPAYGCPALVAAVEHAGARPRLVDLEADRPWMSLDALRAAHSPRVAAVVAVPFLGIPERLNDIRRCCPTTLIEDSAQTWPGEGPRGDLVVLSFGRGKPLSVLGGGAVLSYSPIFRSTSPKTEQDAALVHRLKLSAYNLVTQPLAYGLLERLPGLSLGETRYEALDAIRGIRRSQLDRLAPNLERYRRRDRRIEHRIAEVVAAADVISLPRVCNASGPFLRYPILARDRHHARTLEHALDGLGATRFYGAPLPEVSGVGDRATYTVIDEARRFAERLLTLPTHDGVTDRHVRAIGKALRG